MPRYKCHKEVWALKIKEVHLSKDTEASDGCRGAMLVPEDEGYAPFFVSSEYVFKHKPQAGGYYVVYKDGYFSFSPAGAFEEGYTKV